MTLLVTPLLAAGGIPAFFAEVAALVVASAVVAYVRHRLGLMPIVGFLLTGVLIGPHALGLVTDGALIDAVTEIGVILLLFTIGLEFSLERLACIKRLIFGGGGLQVSLTTLAVVGLLAAFGVGWWSGVYTGFLVALSSTAIVLKLLSDRGETGTPHGQVGVGFLIFQDLAVVAMVFLVPILAGQSDSPLDLMQVLGTAAFSGLFLAQVGEFSFVLERTGREAGLYPAGLGEAGAQTSVAATVVLMIVTPFMAQGGAMLSRWLGRRSEHTQRTGSPPDSAEGTPDKAGAPADLSDHVIIAGYGAGGKQLAAVLQKTGVPYFILTLSPDGARSAEAEGHVGCCDSSKNKHASKHAHRADLPIVKSFEPGEECAWCYVDRVSL